MMKVVLARNRLAFAALALGAVLPAICQAPAATGDAAGRHAALAQQYLRENRPQQAIPEFEQAVALEPKDVGAQANLGVLLYFSGSLREAEPHLRAALALNPQLAKIQALLGSCEHRNGEAAAARTDLAAALPHLDDPKIERQTGLELVEVETAAGDLPAAAASVSRLKAALPTDPEVLFAAYRTYTDLANEAILDLSVAAPDSAQMHQAMAHELSRERNTKAVIANLREAIKADSNLPGVHYELAQALQLSAEPADKAQAEQEYELALKQNSRDDKTLTALGDIFASRGDHAAAIERYRQALAVQPGNTEAGIGMAHELTETGRPEAALPFLEQALKQDPANLLAHYRLSSLYRRLHRTEDAKREVATYQHLKETQGKLRSIYEAMRLQAPSSADDVKE